MIINRFDIPGFREAVEKEASWRDFPFLEMTTDICGIEIQQMTPYHLLILDGIQSPLVHGDVALLHDIARFLWVLSPDCKWGDKRAEKKFGKRCRKLDVVEATIRIKDYLERTFFDSSGGGGPGYSYASWCAHMISHIANQFGWTRSEIMHCPLRIIYQLQKCIVKIRDPEDWVSSGKFSAEVTSKNLQLKQQRYNLLTLMNKRAATLKQN